MICYNIAMSKRNKIIIFIVILLILLALIFVISPKALSAWRWRQATNAAGGLPYQIGLTQVIITPCIVTEGVCVGAGADQTATLACNTKGPGVCATYSYVSGLKSGGMGTGALFSAEVILMAGLTPGGQLIAGGLSPVLMDQGVLASAGGCYGCVAKQGMADKIFAWFDKYIIAGFKSK